MANKKRIAFLLSIITERGGIGRVASLISNALDRDPNIEVHIISYAKKSKTSYDWNEELPYHYLLKEQIPMKRGIFAASKNLKKILLDNNIDILISCGQIVGPLGVLATLFCKTKLIYWSHTSFKGSSTKQFRMLNEHFTALFAKCIITLTKTDEYNYNKDTFAKNVVQIYNPVDIRLENRNTEYKANTSKIISVGRLTYQKNFEALIKVAKILNERGVDFSWHIYGSGEEYDSLSKLIVDSSLQKKVVLKGQSSQLYELYNEYSLMVMTSRFEGFPMSLIEGLACKLPLISFDIPTGPDEIIQNDYNGYLIEPFNIEDMADKISELLSSPNKLNVFSNKSKDILKEFKFDKIINEWKSTLETIN